MGEYCFQRLYRIEDKEIEHITDIEEIQRIENSCKEAIEGIQEIRDRLYKQVLKLQEKKIEKQIIIRRRKEYRGNIEVTVYINYHIQIEGYTKDEMQHKTFQKFAGNEKKQALEYAEELRKKYNYKVIRENWK